MAVAELVYESIATPVGPLMLGASSTALHLAVFGKVAAEHHPPPPLKHAVLTLAKEQLEEYFKGERKQFSVPLCLNGTAFQMKAWSALEKILYGSTVSYQEQARMMGEAEAGKYRAVGGANAKNPICIIVPCHRVVRKGGTDLGGYGYGVHVKQYLLELEGRK